MFKNTWKLIKIEKIQTIVMVNKQGVDKQVNNLQVNSIRVAWEPRHTHINHLSVAEALTYLCRTFAHFSTQRWKSLENDICGLKKYVRCEWLNWESNQSLSLSATALIMELFRPHTLCHFLNIVIQYTNSERYWNLVQ